MGSLMARKNLLKDLMLQGAKPKSEPAAETPEPSEAPAATAAAGSPGRPRYTKGAIGAVSQSIAELKARALTEIDPFLIDQGGVVDRLDDEDADHFALVDSIRDYGQQVPVLLRPSREADGRFQVVYGRRRVKALRELKLPVKAMIRDLDDRELVIAQGQENTARKDLTFIEKANFARQMRDGGYDRKVICDALNVDKTQVSRFLSVADALPVALIEAIGAAPSIGRDRWQAVVKLMEETDTSEGEAVALVNLAPAKDSDGRFEALLKALTLPRRARARSEKARERVMRNPGGVELGRIVTKGSRMTMTVDLDKAMGFDDWLYENFDQIHRDWLKARGE